MPNIAVFRVSNKPAPKRRKFIILFFIVTIILFLLFNKICISSVLFLKLEGTNIIKSADSLIFKTFIEDTFPAVKYGRDVKTQANIDSSFRGIKQRVEGLKIFDYKNVLNTQYPFLESYYTRQLSEVKSDYSHENPAQAKQVKEASQNINEDEEGDLADQKTQKIYQASNVVRSGGIEIRNHTNYKVDIKALKAQPLKFAAKKKGVMGIILHTHTSEAYLEALKGKNSSGDSYRTTNSQYNVVRVGKELEKQLAKSGIKMFHDTTVHDFPAYTGSYKRSLQTAVKDMKKYPTAGIMLDIHRDASGTADEQLRMVTKVGGKDVAKIMFVVGTNEMGLAHPNWKENLKFALKLQEAANKLYPGLCRTIDLRKERFNQHVSPGAVIVEVGGTGNRLEEAVASMRCLAKIIEEVIK